MYREKKYFYIVLPLKWVKYLLYTTTLYIVLKSFKSNQSNWVYTNEYFNVLLKEQLGLSFFLHLFIDLEYIDSPCMDWMDVYVYSCMIWCINVYSIVFFRCFFFLPQNDLWWTEKIMFLFITSLSFIQLTYVHFSTALETRERMILYGRHGAEQYFL